MKRIKLLLTYIIITVFLGQLYGVNHYEGNYRWRNDDGNEQTATWKADESTAITISNDDSLRLRVEAYLQLGFGDLPDGESTVLALGYKKIVDGVEDNWKLITNDSILNAFVLSPSSFVADLDTTSNQLTNEYPTFGKGTIYTSTYSQTLLMFENTSYELEFCIRPTSKMETNTIYRFSLMKKINSNYNSIGGNLGGILLNSPRSSPKVATSVVTTYNENSAIVGGNVINGDEVTERGVVYNTAGNPTVADLKMIIGDNLGAFSDTIKGLALNTTYYVRAYAINSLGTSYGEQSTFTTMVTTVPLVVTSAVTIFDDYSAIVGGNVLQSSGETVTERGVVYNTTGDPTVDDLLATAGGGLNEFSLYISLEPNTTYYVKAFATNKLGTSYGEEVTFTTLKSSPEVVTSEVTTYTAHSAIVGGNVTKDNGEDVIERGVVYNLEDEPTPDDFKVIMGSGLNEFSGNITGLEPHTWYIVRAYATNSLGTSYGGAEDFRTAASTPKVLTNAVVTYNESSAVLGGEVTRDNGDEVTERGVVYNTTGDPTTSDVKVMLGEYEGIFSDTIKGLVLNTTYYVRAYAINSLGTSYGEEVTFTTKAPTSPEVVTSEVITYNENSATLGGNVIQSNGEEVTERGVVYNTAGNPTVADSKIMIGNGLGVFSQNTTELLPNTTYYVKAYAINSVGTSYGEELSFTTKSAPHVSTALVTIFTANSALVGGEVINDYGEEVTERGVVYNTAGEPTVSDSKVIIGSGLGVFSQNIAGLEVNTTYYVKAYAINSIGISYGEEVSFTTKTQPLTELKEGFNNVSDLQSKGWVEINMSSTIGDKGYFQGSPFTFQAYKGDPSAYLQVNFGSTKMSGDNTISNWMITPQLTLHNGDSVSFWTSGLSNITFADRLQFYLNPLGTTDVGADTYSTGDFSVLLQDINPTLIGDGYPDSWTKYSSVISGLSEPTICRFAFRYFVTGVNEQGNSDNIAIDEFELKRPKPQVVTNPVTINNENSASLGGNVTSDYGEEVTERGVVYNTAGNPTVADSKIMIGSGLGVFSEDVTGLAPNTTYYVKAYAINSVGTNYGNEVSFKTKLEVASSSTASELVLSSTSIDSYITVMGNGTILTIDVPVTIKRLIVAPGAGVSLTPGNAFIVTNGITLQSDATGTGTLVDNTTDSPQVLIATVQQYLPQGRNWYVGSPVNSANSSILKAENLASSVVYYDEANSAFSTDYTGNLAPGVGYIAASTAGTASENAVFTEGTLNTGEVDVPLTMQGATKTGFNLVANPYPSYLNAMAAINANANLRTTIWYRTQSKETTPKFYFETVNATSGIGTNNALTGTVTGYIPPMQAFWVRTNADAETLTFTNAMRYHGGNVTVGEGTVPTTPLKAPRQENQGLLRLRVSNGSASDEAIIYTNPNASNSLDVYDSPKWSNANADIPEIYTIAGSEKLVINGFKTLDSDVELTLGFVPGTATSFSITATEFSNFENGTQVLLKDKANANKLTDISDGSAYEFSSDNSIPATNRFSLIFKSPTTVTGIKNLDQSDLYIHRNSNKELVLSTSIENIKGSTVSVYNALGQIIISLNLTSDLTVLKGAEALTGVYFVTIKQAGGNITKKIIL